MAKRRRIGGQSGSMYRSVVTEPRKNINIERNEPCPCESGKKYKHCCGDPDLSWFAKWLRERKLRKIVAERGKSI